MLLIAIYLLIQIALLPVIIKLEHWRMMANIRFHQAVLPAQQSKHKRRYAWINRLLAPLYGIAMPAYYTLVVLRKLKEIKAKCSRSSC